MSDEDLTTVHDLKTMGRGIVLAAGAFALVVGSIIAGTIYVVNLSNEVESHSRWIAKVEKKAEEEARSERWRRERERSNPGTPSAKGGM